MTDYFINSNIFTIGWYLSVPLRFIVGLFYALNTHTTLKSNSLCIFLLKYLLTYLSNKDTYYFLMLCVVTA
jgi:hypothetical protein